MSNSVCYVNDLLADSKYHLTIEIVPEIKKIKHGKCFIRIILRMIPEGNIIRPTLTVIQEVYRLRIIDENGIYYGKSYLTMKEAVTACDNIIHKLI